MAIQTKPARDLQERLFSFALRIVHLCQKLQEEPGVARTLSYQILRSGTSIGANYQEAQAGYSRAEFASKNSIALKESRETCYWLKLLVEAKIIREGLLDDLMDEANQISKILGSIVVRSRSATG